MDQSDAFICARELVRVLSKELPAAAPKFIYYDDTPMVRYHVPWGTGQLRIVIAEKPQVIEAYVYAVDATWLFGEHWGESPAAGVLHSLIPKGDWTEIAFWTLSPHSTRRQQRRLGLAIAEIVYNAFGID
ncbi:MAG TPA: hypothetical protein VHE55_16030 [Fimbriimonadaceae bacterium]|nr:hypothetical protein [Fimbriimonadaceae bacterium]